MQAVTHQNRGCARLYKDKHQRRRTWHNPREPRRDFGAFYSTKEVGNVTGLGLSICYGIVRQHGGELWVESEPGNGATFHIRIPIVAQDGTTGAETQGTATVPTLTKHRKPAGKTLGDAKLDR